jgi:spore maturation protein SpmA
MQKTNNAKTTAKLAVRVIVCNTATITLVRPKHAIKVYKKKAMAKIVIAIIMFSD